MGNLQLRGDTELLGIGLCSENNGGKEQRILFFLFPCLLEGLESWALSLSKGETFQRPVGSVKPSRPRQASRGGVNRSALSTGGVIFFEGVIDVQCNQRAVDTKFV